MIISWDKLEEVTGRNKTMLTLLSKTILDQSEIHEDGLEFDKALSLLVRVGSYAGSQRSEVQELTAKLEREKAEKLQYAVALEMVKSERQQLNTYVSTLERQSRSNEKRAETAEARLHEVTQSFAYLIERQAQEGAPRPVQSQPKAPPLLLLNPITSER